MYWFNFKQWSSSSGRFFIAERLYCRGAWTPIVRFRKRYTSWLGFWGINHALILLFILLATVTTNAQSFIGGGASLIRSSSYDPSPLTRKDGGQTFAGGYVEGGYQFPLGLQARFLGEYLSKPTLYSVFNSDADVGRKPTSEFRFRPELRLRPGCKDARFCLFLAGGVDYFRQRFESTHHEPGPVPAAAYGDYEEGYEYGEHAAGLNPFFTVGAEFGKNHEASFTRLFTDKTSLNRSELHGYRAGYSYTRPLAGRLHFKAAAEADYVIYRDSIGEYVGAYTKRDAVFKIRGGLIFK